MIELTDANDVPTEVATLLAQSHAAHLAYRTAVNEQDKAEALTQLKEAQRTRLEAHAKDPQHTSPAWAGEVLQKFKHDELVEFYKAQVKR